MKRSRPLHAADPARPAKSLTALPVYAMAVVLSAFSLSALAGCRTPAPDDALQLYRSEQPHMGTLFTVSFYAPDKATADRAARKVQERIRELNERLSDYLENSEVRRLLRQPIGRPVPVSEDLFAILERSLALAEETNGAFDPTLGPWIRYWRRARRHKTLPEPADLAQVAPSVGYQNIRLDARNRTVTLLAPDMFIDFGGIAKGYAADQALEELRKLGIDRALVAASGDIRAGDPPPGEAAWKVGIQSIDATGNEYTETIRLKNAAVSTSGDTEQFVEIGGIRYSHIVDPRTGIGLTERIGVTVIAPDATTTDSLATAVSVMGAEAGRQFIKQREGVEGMIVQLIDGRKVRQQTEGFAAFAIAEDPPANHTN